MTELTGQEPPLLYCSFCGLDHHSVGLLIAGPNDVFICNNCVDLCNVVIDKQATKENKE